MFDAKKVLRMAVGIPRVLVLGACLASSLFAQAQQGQMDNKDNKQAPGGNQPVTAGTAVDSTSKSANLAPSWDQTGTNQGEVAAGYEIKQSAEFGGRLSDFTGNAGVWDTFVNLGSGPRLLEYTLELHSPDHTGLLFDDLTFTNFGYGGDPNDLSRVTAQKGKLYDFSGSFRRDQNIFDYDLLANPLNPAASNPDVPILNTPHEFLLTRRMSDANLRLFPLGQVRFRFGWSRVVNEGTTFSTFHQGTEALLRQPTLNTSDSYTAGVSLRFIPCTTINYD